MHKLKIGIAIWVTIGLLLAACGGSAPQPTPTPVPPTAKPPEATAIVSPQATVAPPTAVPPTATSAPLTKPDHVVLDFWYSLGGSSGQAVEDLVKQFNESQSYIEVKATYQGGYAEIMAKTWNAIYAEQTLPQVAQLGGAPLVGATGACAPITDFTDGPNGIDRSKIYDAFWKYNMAGGTIWAMPFNNSVPLLYYNKEMFKSAGLDPDKPPETWDDVIQYGEALSDGSSEWGFNTHDDTHWYFSTMVLENGGQIVNADETEVLYNSPEAVEMLTLWGDMVNDYEIMPPAQHTEAGTDFLAGTLGMLMRSSSVLPSMVSDASFDVGVAMVPAVAGKPRVAPIGGGSLVIFKNKNSYILDAAWEFVKFMTSEKSSLYVATHTGYVPIYKDALEWPELQAYLKDNPLSHVPIEQLQYSYAIPVFASLGTSDSSLRQAIEAVELGASDPQAALDQAKTIVDQDIKDQQKQ